MTVCIGTLCESRSSVVLVSDRMMTSGLSIEFEHPVSKKITELSDNCLALTAGNALAYTELFNDVLRATENRRFTAAEEFVEVIKESYQKLRRKRIVERVLLPRSFPGFVEFYQVQSQLAEGFIYNILSEIERFDYNLEILVGGVTGESAHLYAIDDPGTSYCFDSIGFHAIGSGLNLALSSLIASGCNYDLDLEEAILVALDAKMTSENAPGVGKRTDLSIILKGGIALHFDDEQIKRLRDLAHGRRNGERDFEDEIPEMIASLLKTKGFGLPMEDKPTTISDESPQASEASGEPEPLAARAENEQSKGESEGVSTEDAGDNEVQNEHRPTEG